MRNFGKCILYDIRQGTRKQYYIYIIAVLLFFFLGMNTYSEFKIIFSEMTMADIAVRLFYGADIFFEGNVFQIPYNYMLITAFLGISIGSYVVSDYKNMGVIHIIKYRDKKIWWYGKCAWNICHTVLLFAGIFCGIMLFGCLIGTWSWRVSSQTVQSMSYSMLETGGFLIFCYIFLLGAATVIVLNQIQITLQMIFGPVIAYIVYLGNLVFSVLIYSRFLPGNNLMLCRTKIFQGDGIEILFEAVYLFILWFAAVLLGGWYLKKKDIL